MLRVAGALRRYPLIGLTLLVAAAGGALELTGQPLAARGLLSLYTLAFASRRCLHMVAALRQGRYGVDVLAVTAIVATVAVGESWASLVVVLMLTTGEALDAIATGRATRELSALMARAPQTAHLRLPDGQHDRSTDVPIHTVCAGDTLLVKPGEILPVDGVLLSASGAFDESSLTGESLPVEHTRGEHLLSGSVNGSRAILLRATAAAADSQYQRIVDLVESAQRSRAPFVRLADRVAVPFTLLAFALAGGAWWLSGDAGRFAEVLVVATPCPLLIAAPVAFMAGMSRAAKLGIIVKGGGTLEELSRVRTAAFDKTGTLTRGAPELATVQPANGLGDDDLLATAASVELFSTHPLASAIVAGARERGLEAVPAVAASEATAQGATATVDGHRVVVGKATYIAEEAGGIPPLPLEPGESAVHVAIDGRYAGQLALADHVRPEARRTLAALRRSGVRHTLMLTGDADLVGDGVNDAPVLAAAEVGVAMGARGSTAASESADVVVMLDDLYRAVRAVQIGRRTMRVAWQAIGIGLGLSFGLMLVAAAGFLPAIAGAWAQELVDLVCILWALLAHQAGAEEREAGAVPG